MRANVRYVAAALMIAGCRGAGTGSGERFFTELPIGANAALPVPAANPLVCERVALGRRLFFETQLSYRADVSCATCHVPSRAFTDGRPLPVGGGGALGQRHAPTLVNRAYGKSFFWDGRAATLEEQALQPLTNPSEFHNSLSEIERRLRANRAYRRQFAAAFGTSDVSAERVSAALAAFVRTIVSGDSPADRFIASRDSTALSPSAQRGFGVFSGNGRCVVCHEPLRFTDELFHNTGVAWQSGRYADSGRVRVTARAEDVGAFKTPTLRNVAITAPYMHDGSMATLSAVIDFYDGGGRTNAHLDPLVRPLGLTGTEKADLVSFLESLTGTVVSLAEKGCR